ncbi:MAG: hypothetical protein AAF919_17175 [Pseudomonadota bacterium]
MRPALLLPLVLALPAWAEVPQLRYGLWINTGEMFVAEPECPASLVRQQQEVAAEFAERDELLIQEDDPLGLTEMTGEIRDWTKISDDRWETPILSEEGPHQIGTMHVEFGGPELYRITMSYVGENIAPAIGAPLAHLRGCEMRYVTIWTHERDLTQEEIAAAVPEEDTSEGEVSDTGKAAEDVMSEQGSEAPVPTGMAAEPPDDMTVGTEAVPQAPTPAAEETRP